MRVAIVGAGALGCLFGAFLARAGHDVRLIHVRREPVEAINRRGLRIEGPNGEQVIRAAATTDPGEVGAVDLVVVLVKAPRTREAVSRALPLVAEQTLVLTLQNGLGNLETLAAVVGAERVAGGLTHQGAVLLGSGHVRHTRHGETYLGEPSGARTARLETVAQAFTAAGLPTRVTDRLTAMLWGKLVLTAAINATCALTGCTVGELLEFPSARDWIRLVAAEAARVAVGRGVELPYMDPAAEVLRVCADAGGSIPSMLQDVRAGRMTEIDAINGALVREGRLAGVPTPYNQALTMLVGTLEGRARAPRP